MPRGNGTGPPTGGGRGAGRGGGYGSGPGGKCICPNCKATVSHSRGTPCYQVSCPKCGTRMTRKR